MGDPVKPQPPCVLQGVQSILVDQRRVGARCQQALDDGRVSLHDRQDQRCAPGRVGSIDRSALLQQALKLLQVSGAGGLLQRACQPE